MKSLCITSNSDFAGKNLLLVGLGHKIKKDGYDICIVVSEDLKLIEAETNYHIEVAPISWTVNQES